MGKYKYLIKNIGILTIGNFSSKILTFLLVPFYTNLLTLEEYGEYDLISIVVTLMLPILSINISEGVLRLSIDKKDDEVKSVFSIGLKYTLLGILLLIIVLVVNNVIGIVEIVKRFGVYLFLIYSLQSILQLLINFARGIDRLKEISIGGVISSLVTITLNLILLGYYKMGIDGYFIATVLGNFITVVYFIFRLRVWRFIKLRSYDKKLEKEIVFYSVPLILNTIGWWINNASDRFVVTYFYGVSQNGLYSVAYKIPAILTVFQNIFNQAWILSSVKEFDKNDKNGFFKNVYSTTNMLMCLVCFVLVVFTKIIARFMFSNDFYNAWFYAPLLIFAVVFGTLAGSLGGVFNTVNETKVVGFSTFVGALINLVLNIVLVYKFGPIGAAVSTLISAMVVWVIRLIKIKKHIKLIINGVRDCLVYLILLAQILLLYFNLSHLTYYSVSVFNFSVIVLCFYKDIYRAIKFVKNR